MAVAMMIPVLLLAVVARSRCDVSSPFGELLKPPPPPSNLAPVPFHGGGGGTRVTRHHGGSAPVGYNYLPPPPPSPPLHNNKFKFPAPFYKQYNFNFVPPPQPFTTTPSPTLFQKVSTWLFPSPQPGYDGDVTKSATKKECNSCNSLPWIPVIRYEAGKNIHQDIQPTYGQPSPTALANQGQSYKYSPHPFHTLPEQLPQLSPGVPHQVYGPPSLQQSFAPPSSTYGPPSATHEIDISSHNPPSSTYGIPSSSYGVPSSSLSVPSSSYGVSSSSYSVPSSSYGIPNTSYGAASTSYGAPSSSFSSVSTYGAPSSTNGPPSSTYGMPGPTFATPSPSYGNPSTLGPPTIGYDDVLPNYQPPQAGDVELFKITDDQQLPKVSQPTGFKNSYGEPIRHSYLDLTYPVSAAEGSTKVKTELLPNGQSPDFLNGSFAIGKPAGFTSNRGRNIHTLQPVALPNLSVSPLPPIFNARPFRPTPNFLDVLSNQQQSNKVSITQSHPVAQFSSHEYPPTFVQSPLIDITVHNQSKGYRHIGNTYVIDQNRDISSQASEDHISASNTNNELQESSFESTGAEYGNDLYDMPSELKNGQHNRVPPNHKENFADLRGSSDDDVDKYRTESNLQSIDSPLLYLKPSAPHKDYEHFLLAVSTPATGSDYELYDESPTTPASSIHDKLNSVNYGQDISAPSAQEDSNKPKIVQIIIPYTSDQHRRPSSDDFDNQDHEWASASEDEYQARKVPANTENYSGTNTATDGYSSDTTTTEDPSQASNEYYESHSFNTPAILNDLYDVKEPPFDIIKLQQNIDDWTEQQYSQHRPTPKVRLGSGKYAHAKQIPDEYFTTLSPLTNFVTNYAPYDHEGSGSVHHSVSESSINYTRSAPIKEYNTIQRGRQKTYGKSKPEAETKPYIYTAASSFRLTTTTTPAPWGKIETSISPLTKEKVYVVTSKPWRETTRVRNYTDWFSFESKKTESNDNDASASDNLPFRSPRFLTRPSFGATASDETLKSEASQTYSKTWHQSINDLETQQTSYSVNITTTLPEESRQNDITTANAEEIPSESTTLEPSEE